MPEIDLEPGPDAEFDGTSDQLLKKIGAISVHLESGQKVSVNIHRELRIPDDPVALVEAQSKASAQYAFWAYQEEVQLGRVRALERKVEFVEGGYDQPIRNQLHEQTPGGITESAVKSVKDTYGEIRQARLNLDRARKEFGKLRAMRKALDHRCFALDRLVARMADVQKG